ncbi:MULTISPECIES: alpha/beta hydrolase family protein [unclassified Bradyrhizobium]|uniref:alpha/beta hydrolase family protein n=1 Tax=unclassified Bradyrhizobium TaxID=2631580 RepID=UPI002915C7B7|nr:MULTISPECIES: hydrolase [unclassified Bradyrhizobium]
MLHRIVCALVLAFCFASSPTRAAGIQFLDSESKLKGAIWTPCAAAPQEVPLGQLGVTAVETLPGVKDCPIKGDRLPLIVFSHGRGGWFGQHHDLNEALADAGFVVAAISHPGDSFGDDAQRDSLSNWESRPAHIVRLIDFMLNDWKDKAAIDPDRIGFFGFSKGGYTGLVLAGADPDFSRVAHYCTDRSLFCEQVHSGDVPKSFAHDRRIKAAVLADTAPTGPFADGNLASIKIPLQIWRSRLGGHGADPEGTARVAGSLWNQPDTHVVPAAHYAFLAPCSAEFAAAVPRICTDDPPDFDRAAFHRVFDAEVVRFFSEHLMGR